MQSSSKLFEYLFSSCRTSFHLETERRQMQDVMSLAYLYLNRLIHYLPTSFITANSAELFLWSRENYWSRNLRSHLSNM